MAKTPIEDLEDRIRQAIGPDNQDALPGILASIREISQGVYENQVTGAPGLKRLEADIESMRAPKDDQDVYVVMLDIDNFGEFNKHYGEEVGNDVLRGVTRIIGETLREDDVVLRVSSQGADYHIHGEEMLALYICKNLRDAINVSERIVKQVADRTEEEIGYKVTVSAGVTKFDPETEEFCDAKARADRYMQFAKLEGKNKTYTADECKDPLFEVKKVFYRSGIVDNLARKVPNAVKLAKGIVGRTATNVVNLAASYLKKVA